MKRTYLLILAIVLAIAALAGVLIVIGASQMPQIGSGESTGQGGTDGGGASGSETSSQSGGETASGTDGVTGSQTPSTSDPSGDPKPPSTSAPDSGDDPPEITPPDTGSNDPAPLPSEYVIPEAFRDFTVVEGDRVIMTWGGYRVSFSTAYQLVDVGGVPSLIAPDGSSARLSYTTPPKDVNALKQDPNYVSGIIRDVLAPVSSAKLISSTEMMVMPMYGTDVGVFGFTVALGGTEIDYSYLVFSDEENFYTVTLGLVDGTPYDFSDVVRSLEKVEQAETTPVVPETSKPETSKPETSKPAETDPPVTDSPETEDAGVVLPPDEFEEEDGDYKVPDAFKDDVTVNGSKVTMRFGGYRVTFPTTYQLVDLGGGMPGLIAPDGSMAKVTTEPSDEKVTAITQARATAIMNAEIQANGGSGMTNQAGPFPLTLPMIENSPDTVVFQCNYTAGGTVHELSYVIFNENGQRYTICRNLIKGTVYDFTELVLTLERAE